ncbi:SRPBCC domain-containing protein [Phenylobacterium deserti]|uniref:Polyketide cyclase n=1 Tax=Phenylobacterium deserti TaxID=1914756 RepID=A0A328AHL6_9CAUL|nr:SRPBCC domain-containing protein [Phenylobacterium deserti]RAK52854.1 polyketide cyclase [Phenylobacterium deserti]
MDTAPVVHDTFVLRRTYPLPATRLFAAFADPAKKRRWYAEAETHDVEAYEMEFRAGGIERFRYRFREGTPFPGVELSSEGVFQEITHERRIVTASRMLLGEHCISATLVTIEIFPTAEGCELVCTHQGAFFEGSDGPQMRKAGWEALFDKLAQQLGN